MNLKNKTFKKILFYLGAAMFIASVLLFGKVPYMPALSILGLITMCAFPVNKIKRKQIK